MLEIASMEGFSTHNLFYRDTTHEWICHRTSLTTSYELKAIRRDIRLFLRISFPIHTLSINILIDSDCSGAGLSWRVALLTITN